MVRDQSPTRACDSHLRTTLACHAIDTLAGALTRLVIARDAIFLSAEVRFWFAGLAADACALSSISAGRCADASREWTLSVNGKLRICVGSIGAKLDDVCGTRRQAHGKEQHQSELPRMPSLPEATGHRGGSQSQHGAGYSGSAARSCANMRYILSH